MKMNWFALAVIVYIILSAHRGFRKGLLLSVFSVISLLLAAVFTVIFTPIVGNALGKEVYLQLKDQCGIFLKDRLPDFQGNMEELTETTAHLALYVIGAGFCLLVIGIIILIARIKLGAWLDHSVLHLPDMLCGMVLGFGKAILVIWIVFFVIGLTASFIPASQQCMQQIEDNSILQALYENNLFADKIQVLFQKLVNRS